MSNAVLLGAIMESESTPNVEDFRREIGRMLDDARSRGLDEVVLISGDVHRELGGYPGPNHAMPSCCKAMRELMGENDEILHQPPKGNGATLKIRYLFKTDQS